jgi:hypothetical protein
MGIMSDHTQAQLLDIRCQADAANARIQGMIIENATRLMRGESIAYTENNFQDEAAGLEHLSQAAREIAGWVTS